MIDNDQSYFEACNPRPIAICGEEIEFISLGHIQQLKGCASLFLTPNFPDMEHLLTALWICSQPVEPCVNTANKKLSIRWKIASQIISWMDLFAHQRIDREIRRLKDYIDDVVYFKAPVSKKDRDLSRESTCPVFLPLKRVLMNHYGYSEWEVLNMPYKQARWEHAAWLEHEGALEFKTRKEESMLKRMLSPESIERNKRFWKERSKLRRN